MIQCLLNKLLGRFDLIKKANCKKSMKRVSISWYCITIDLSIVSCYDAMCDVSTVFCRHTLYRPTFSFIQLYSFYTFSVLVCLKLRFVHFLINEYEYAIEALELIAHTCLLSVGCDNLRLRQQRRI